MKRGAQSKFLLSFIAIFLLFVAPLALAEGAERLISGIYYDVPMREVLEDVSKQAKINILADASVEGSITAEFKNMPLDYALTMILTPGGYTFRDMGGYYLVGRADPSNLTFTYLSETKVIKLSYLSAETAKNVLSEFFIKFIKVDPISNSLIITASPEIIERIEADIKLIDQPSPQVLLEVLVVEIAKEDVDRTLGVNWSGKFLEPKGYDAISFSDILSTMGYTVTERMDEILGLLKVLASEEKVQIHASPKVTTLDGMEAQIFVGKDLYVRVPGTDVKLVYTTQVGTTLKFKPRISSPGELFLSIAPEVSEVEGYGTQVPYINRRQVNTNVRVKDGETIVIGGLFQTNQEDVVVKVPVLGDVPVIGTLFKSKRTIKEETELVIFITPRIITNGL